MATPKKATKKPPPKSAAQLATEKKMRQNAANAAKQKQQASIQADRDYYAKNGHIPTILANLSGQYFDSKATPDVYSQLGHLVATGKMSRADAETQIKRGRGITDLDALRAGLDVAAQIDPQENAITRKREAGKTALDTLLAQQQQTGQRTNADLAGLYAALNQNIKGNTAQLAELYAKQQAGMQANGSQAQAAIQQAFADAQARTQPAVEGMGAGPTQAQSYGQEDSAFFRAAQALNQQAALNELATNQTGALGTNTAFGNAAAFDGTRSQADVLRKLLEQTNNERADWSSQDQELAGQFEDLEGSRYNKLYEGRQALSQTRAQQEQAAADREFEHRLAEQSLGIKQFDAETGRMKAQQAATAEYNRHAEASKRLQIEQQKASDPLQRQLLQAKIDKENADAAAALAKAAAGPNGKLDNYTRGMQIIANIPGIRPDQVNFLQGLVDSAAARSQYDKMLITTGNQFMMDRLNQTGNQSDAVRRYVRQALAIVLGAV